MGENSIAYDLVKDLSKMCKKQFVIIIFLIIGMVINNCAWIYYVNQFSFESIEVITEGETATAIYQSGEQNSIQSDKTGATIQKGKENKINGQSERKSKKDDGKAGKENKRNNDESKSKVNNKKVKKGV